MIVECSESQPLRKVTFQSSLCGRMQRNQPTLAELCIANDMAVGSDIFQSQINRFRQAHPGTCQQSEEGAVGKPAIRRVRVPPDLRCSLDDALDIFS